MAPHIFVETNWLFAYAAPAHHQVPAAAELLDRARRGEFTVHMPNICLGEARQAILTKCQPGHEANALRRFLTWGLPAGHVTEADAATARVILSKYESSIKQDLDNLDNTLRTLAGLRCIDIFGLDDTMLDRATELALAGIAPKPFDHAILASVLVRASRLWDAGERSISFCETDKDLQPWDSTGTPSHHSEKLSIKPTSGCTETLHSPSHSDGKVLSDQRSLQVAGRRSADGQAAG